MPLRSAHSLRTRVSAFISALLTGAILLFAVAAYLAIRQSTVAATRERLGKVTTQIHQMLVMSTTGMRSNASGLARSPAVRSYFADSARSAAALVTTLRQFAVGTRTLVGVELWNAARAPLFSTSRSVPALDSTARHALTALVGDRDTTAIGWMSVSHDSVIFPVISRVYEGTRPLGYTLSWWHVTQSAQTKRSLAELIGSDARLSVGNSRGDLWTDLAEVVRAPLFDRRLMPVDTEAVQLEGKTQFTALRSLAPTPWTLAIEFPREPVLAQPRRILRDLSLYVALLVLLGAVLAWALAGKLTRPISELAAASSAVRVGDYGKRVNVGRADEIGALGTAFNEMAESVADAHRQLEQKVTELGASEARYRMLFESNPQATWVFDRETLRFLAVNDAAVQAYGYSRDEFLRMTILDIRLPEDVEALRKELSQPMSEMIERRIARHRLKDGRVIDVELSWHGLEFDGRPATLALAHDVTERRTNEAALRATQQRLEHVLAASGAIIYRLRIVGEDTVLDWMSENVTRLFGYAVSEAMSADWWRANVHPDDMRRMVAAGSRSPLVDVTREYRFRRSDGVYRWVRDDQRVMRDSGGALTEIVGTWLDITEQRSLEAQFLQAQKLEAVGRLAGGVAHDFNNVLTVVLGECDMVLAALGAQHPARESVIDIRRAGERASHLTRQLLTFSRRQLVEPVVFSCNDVVRDMQSMLYRLIGEHVQLTSRLDPALGLVLADVGQTEQVLVNLVVNARDAMPHGGSLMVETANVSLDVDYARVHAGVVPGDYVMLTVSDTGTGISDEVRAHLFEPFFTTKETGKGTGLGLATCYAILKQFGGHIGVYSEMERGTTMKVYMPRVASSASLASPPASLQPSRLADPPGGTETILLVEDDVQVRAVASRMLRARGYLVVEAGNGDDAIAILADYPSPVHLLLTDVVLPGIGGRELSERAHRIRPEMRILFTSGYTEDVILQHRLLERGIALVQKPFTADSLLRKVRESLEGTPNEV